MNTEGQNLRVRLIGIETPVGMITSIHQDTTLNAKELRHLLPIEYLRTLFPSDAGINFDFIHNISKTGNNILYRDGLVIHSEEKVVACLNDKLMQPYQKYPLAHGNGHKLKIGTAIFRMDVLKGYF
jgi:hypothetical protein